MEEKKEYKVAEKLKNYQIKENIGQGAFGEVNLAKDLKSGKFVAIKTVNKMQTV